MKVAVNIGNTNTVVAFGDKRLTLPTSSIDEEQKLLDALSDVPSCVARAAVASVVPQKTEVVCAVLEKRLGKPPLVVDASTPLGLDLSRYDCQLVGMDRLMACYAASIKYTPPFAVFDLGTATTVNIVDAGLVFLGGAIMPGIQAMLDALVTSTALLPETISKGHVPFIGSDTVSCLQAGTVQATIGFLERYHAGLKARLGEYTTMIVTGGNASFMLENGLKDVQYEPELVIQGLLRFAS